jgi:nitroreductase
MNPVLEAIKSRRSARVLKSEPIPKKDDVIEILEAGIWSPNNHLTEPWRFVVLAGDERLRLGEAMAAFVRRTAKESDPSTVDANEHKLNVLTSSCISPIHVCNSKKNGDSRASFTSSAMMCSPFLSCPCSALSMHQQL